MPVFLAVRHELVRIGRERVTANKERFKSANELFGAIKDIKLLNRESEFIQTFSVPSRQLARHMALAAVVGQVPRFALEIVAFGGVLAIAVYLLARGGGLQQVIPMLGLYVFAGYRLMPSLQQIFHALAQFGSAAPLWTTCIGSSSKDRRR